MTAATIEVRIGQVHRLELTEILTPHRGELLEQAAQRLPFRCGELREAIELVEGACLAMLEDDPRPRYPIGVFAMNQMADDVERTPGLPTFMGRDPACW